MFCFSRANHTLVQIWFELKTRQVYFIYSFPRELCKLSTSSRVCITDANSVPTLLVFISGYANAENVITWLESQINISSRPLRTCFFSAHFIHSNVIVQEPQWTVGAEFLCRPQPHRVWAQVLPDRKRSPCLPFKATTKQTQTNETYINTLTCLLEQPLNNLTTKYSTSPAIDLKKWLGRYEQRECILICLLLNLYIKLTD